mmetsp:Transcript_4661/g.15030  ORF Transcript_4661/g.15030 Transcript_4661/m.15030 type:complete len:212 (-) Transcript_4661:467-1102(-)
MSGVGLWTESSGASVPSAEPRVPSSGAWGLGMSGLGLCRESFGASVLSAGPRRVPSSGAWGVGMSALGLCRESSSLSSLSARPHIAPSIFPLSPAAMLHCLLSSALAVSSHSALWLACPDSILPRASSKDALPEATAASTAASTVSETLAFRSVLKRAKAASICCTAAETMLSQASLVSLLLSSISALTTWLKASMSCRMAAAWIFFSCLS